MSKSADKILTTAEQLFNAQSFNAVGVDLIRDESGCSKTTMYTYFKNKQQLVCKVLKQRDQNFRESLKAFVTTTDPLIAIEQIFTWHKDWFQTDHFKGCLFVRAVAESSRQDVELIEISIQHKVWIRDFIRQHIANLQHAEQITELFFNLLEGLISRFLVENYDENVVQDAQKSLLLLVNILQNHTE